MTTPSSNDAGMSSASQPTLLVVDDESFVLSAIRRVLRDEGYRVLTATHGAEALSLLVGHRVEVVLSDHRMPGMLGTDFLARVMSEYPATVRIMLSSEPDLQSVREAAESGVLHDVLAKPWDNGHLRWRIREAFARYPATAEPPSGESPSNLG